VVHRDLKPANLIFPPAAGGGFHVKLADFGIAKLFGETGLTRSGSVVGTPEYMAPEQAASQHVDRRGDLYSLGLVMFAMLAGKPPFQGAVADVLESQRSREPPRITTLVRDVPKPLADLIERLLEKSPGRRPNNATIVARMLADVASAASKPSEPFAPSSAMPEVPDGLPTTIVTDAAGNTAQSSSHTAKATHASSRGGPSTFTTREEDARDARIEHERKSRAHWPRSLLMTAMALAIIASVLAGGWFVGKQVFFPSADAVHARIIQIAQDPNENRLEDPPFDKIEEHHQPQPLEHSLPTVGGFVHTSVWDPQNATATLMSPEYTFCAAPRLRPRQECATGAHIRFDQCAAPHTRPRAP
jgi:serine/threonine-protein kinase